MQTPPEVPITLVAINDDPASLRLVRKVLDQEDLEILVSTDAVEGLELVFRKRPHIVLLDLNIPKLSGMGLLKRIVAVLPETAVILIAGHYSGLI